MTFFTPRVVSLLLAFQVILISVILIFLHILPNPLNPLMRSDSPWNTQTCTREARLCSDGSYVGRSGPACEFTPCLLSNTRITEIHSPTTTPPTNTSSSTNSSHKTTGGILPPPKKDMPPNTICTMDAKQCPDGSYVGRSGPKCEFKACPTTGGNTLEIVSVSGSVTVGPVCPVMRNPPDPDCADKPYSGTIILTNTSSGKDYYVSTNSDGTFTVSLTRGVYDVSRPVGDNPFPRCGGKVEITNPSTKIPISCDTGIR